MKKPDVITEVAELAEGTKTDAERYITAFLKVLERAVENGEPIKLVGHFTLDTVPTKQRVGRNPQTKEEVIIPAGRRIRFKPGKILKDLVK